MSTNSRGEIWSHCVTFTLGFTLGMFMLFVSFPPNFFFNCMFYITSNIAFRIAVFPHSTGVVYYHLLLRRETRIPGVAPFSFRIGIWDLLVHRGQKSYTPTAFGKLWTTPGVRCMKSCYHNYVNAFSGEIWALQFKRKPTYS